MEKIWASMSGERGIDEGAEDHGPGQPIAGSRRTGPAAIRAPLLTPDWPPVRTSQFERRLTLHPSGDGRSGWRRDVRGVTVTTYSPAASSVLEPPESLRRATVPLHIICAERIRSMRGTPMTERAKNRGFDCSARSRICRTRAKRSVRTEGATLNATSTFTSITGEMVIPSQKAQPRSWVEFAGRAPVWTKAPQIGPDDF